MYTSYVYGIGRPITAVAAYTRIRTAETEAKFTEDAEDVQTLWKSHHPFDKCQHKGAGNQTVKDVYF